MYVYCGNNPVIFADETGEIFFLVTGAIGAAIGAITGAIVSYAVNGKVDWKSTVVGAIAGGAIGAGAGALIATYATGTAVATTSEVLLMGSKWTAALAASGATASASLGRTFEKWFYDAYNIAKNAQQVVIKGIGRVDALVNGYIYELKNYNWDKYSASQLSCVARRFVSQANKYLSAENVKGLIYYFSSEPPKEVKEALEAIGAVIRWITKIR